MKEITKEVDNMDLKKCPFCGEDPQYAASRCSVECDTCGIQTRECETDDEAEELWNDLGAVKTDPLKALLPWLRLVTRWNDNDCGDLGDKLKAFEEALGLKE